MRFAKRLAFRLGFILVLAIGIRLIGGLFAPDHPQTLTGTMTDRFGNSHAIPVTAIASARLDAPLTDPDMKKALEVVRLRQGGQLGVGSGAKMSYRSMDGMVTLTTAEIAELNNEYRALKQPR